jgi:hypothetical protein
MHKWYVIHKLPYLTHAMKHLVFDSSAPCGVSVITFQHSNITKKAQEHKYFITVVHSFKVTTRLVSARNQSNLFYSVR